MSKPIGLAMLIEDQAIDRRMYQRVLEKSDLVEEILAFEYADEALAHLKQNPALVVDVIFLDINIPRMSGFQFLEAASKELGTGFAKLVVAMLTTSLDPEDERRARKFGVVREFINKPLRTDDVERVANALA